MLSEITKLHDQLIHMGRAKKRLALMALDALVLPVCLWSAYVLRLADWWPTYYLEPNWWLFPLVSLGGVAIFQSSRLYLTILRFAGSKTIIQIVQSVLLLTVVLTVAGFFVVEPVVPRSVPVIFGLVTLLYVSGSRFFLRHYYHWILNNFLPHESVAIYGAGGAGVQLAVALADSEEYKAVAFMDDDPSLWGSLVQGLRVYPPSSFQEVEKKYNVGRVLLAMPSASLARKRHAVNQLVASDVKVLTVPSMPEIVEGKASVDLLRAVQIEDLLGRDPVPPQQALIDDSIKGRSVLVTGAGGSIGSELCRIIATAGPSRLILYEISEYNLYQIEQVLSAIARSSQVPIEIIPILGSVCDRGRLTHLIEQYKVETFYHAAAYKHVPLVEHNVLEGVRNNIIGTAIASEIALACGVERFVLVSTDKAVRPTNVMGATKRFAELIVQAQSKSAQMGASQGDSAKVSSRFSIVRFGNVLGSSGSVVPLFRRQIAEGGPLTVTHPEITRYFMTIPEAALLVIQAGSMAQGGDVFVLEMGEEVKIVDLAKQMIKLSGFDIRDQSNPSGDIEITYEGLRPGEKLKEELLIGENVSGTEHPRIMRVMEEMLTKEQIDAYLSAFRQSIEANDPARAKQLLDEAVTGYQSSSHLVDNLAGSDKPIAQNVIKLAQD